MVGFPVPVSDDVFNLLLVYGAFRDLGVRQMPNTKTKFAKVTALPASVFITPTATGAGRAIPVDTTLAGDSVSQQCNIVATLIEISLELLEDQKVDLAGVLLPLFVQSLAKCIDFGVFQGTGADDQTSGLQTGIFQDNTVASVNANQANVAISNLERADFLSAVGAVATASLQRPCRWFINPGFIPTLLTLKDGAGPKYLLKTPAETQGEWHLVGFPVTWAAQAPGVNAPGSKVAAFGEPNSYLVGVREDLEIGTATGAKFSQAIQQIRAIARARADMRESTGWATLKLAAQ
jgi:HK97 family phage major capsid protein